MRGPLDADGPDVVELLREQIVAVLPSHHALARRRRRQVQLLHDLPCIVMERSLSPALHDAIAALYRQAHIRMHAVSTADNVLGHLRLVQEGLGFALLPDSVGALLPSASSSSRSPAIRSRPCRSWSPGGTGTPRRSCARSSRSSASAWRLLSPERRDTSHRRAHAARCQEATPGLE